MFVYPRLDQGVLGRLVDEYRAIVSFATTPSEAVTRVRDHVEGSVLAPGRISHNPVGTTPVDEKHLHSLRAELRETATRHGYPAERPGDGSPNWARYDRRTARVLHSAMKILPSDAGIREVWAHMNGWLVPDLVLWRWGMPTERPKGGDARFGHGSRWHDRNQMGRLWWRQEILGDLYATGNLGEDQLVSIIERASLGFNPPLARAIARQWMERVDDFDVSGEDLMRDVTKRLRRSLPHRAVYSLDPTELDDLVARALDESGHALETTRQ